MLQLMMKYTAGLEIRISIWKIAPTNLAQTMPGNPEHLQLISHFLGLTDRMTSSPAKNVHNMHRNYQLEWCV